MESQNNHKLSSFWFGFLLGGTITGSAAFFFGTKQGRKTLKKLLEMTEDIEGTVQTFFEEYGEEIREKGTEIIDEVKKPSSTIHGILDKIKILSPSTQKKVKRFFVKEGKIIESKSA